VSNAAQQEERNKRIAIIAFAVVFVGIAIYAYESFFATAPPPPSAAPAVATRSGGEGGAPTASSNAPTNASAGNANASSAAQAGGLGVAPGVAAQKMASTSSSLDPTLDESAMLRTEGLVYAGTGRNIFSMTSVAAAVALPKVVPNPRPGPVVQQPVVQQGPPPLPPINLKFFGTEQRSNAPLQAFLSHGDDIYLASQGDIVARIYKILKITERNIQVEDLSNQNTQTLPLQAN
jgi:hypothetical protein